MDWDVIGCCLLAFVLYINTFNADFVYDDRRTILSNEDIWSSSWTRLFFNDFWGTPLNDSGSHGSYRPLCIISYKLNYLVSSMRPWSYHVGNVLIHCLITGLLMVVSRRLFPLHFQKEASLYTGLLFAVHPIHTEAVASVVGRADLLATLFSLLSLYMYMKHVSYRYCHKELTAKKTSVVNYVSQMNELIDNNSMWKSKNLFKNCLNVITNNDCCYFSRTCYFLFALINILSILLSTISITFISLPIRKCSQKSKRNSLRSILEKHSVFFIKWTFLGFCLVFATLALLCKETGICALILCLIYDLTYTSLCFSNKAQVKSIMIACCGLLTLLCSRFFVINEAPKFSKSDNPASHNPAFLSRCLTFSYLPIFNFYLLLYPKKLSFDWSMNSIPQIYSIFDVRNVYSLIFYSLLCVLFRKTLSNLLDSSSNHNSCSPSCSRSKFFNYYYHKRNINNYRSDCYLIIDSNNNHSNKKKFIDCNNSTFFSLENKILLCCCHTCQNVYKEYHYFLSYRSSHLINNCQSSAAVAATKEAIFHTQQNSYRLVLMSLAFLIVPFLPAANLFFYVGFVIAERILYLPSIGYCLFFSLILIKLQNKLKLFQKLIHVLFLLLLITFSIRTLVRNQDWKNEEALFRSALHVNPPKAYGNLGSVLNTQKRFQEAEFAYRKALEFRPNMADVHYNLGVLLHQKKKYDEAIRSFENAIHFRPTLALAYVNLGAVLVVQGKCQKAKEIFEKATLIDGNGLKDRKAHESSRASAFIQLGSLYAAQGLIHQAMNAYKEALHILPNSRAPDLN